MAFKKLKYSRKSSVRQLLGADFEVVRAHLEETFKEGMSWSNHGLWHIDHRKPLAGAADEDTLRQLFHYKNLQALWATENLSKGTRHVD
jgi:hypothetical protein